jgi:hypothetical protein
VVQKAKNDPLTNKTGVWEHIQKKEEVMKLPKQVPAVERKVNKEAALPVGAKVCPAAWWNDLIQAAPGIIGGLGSMF